MSNLRPLVAMGLFLSVVLLTGVLYQTGDVPADETVTRVEIDSQGDGVFELELQTRLNTDERREAFEAFENDVEQDPESFVSSFRDSVVPIVESARNRTDREMSATNFTVETSVEPLPVERGVVRYSFEWSGFAEVDGGSTDTPRTVRAGDVLSAYILSEGDSLVFLYPEEYVVESVDPTPNTNGSGEVRWDGPRDFSDEQPRLTVVEETENSTVGGDGEGTTDEEGEGEGERDSGDPSLPLYVYAVVVLVLLSVAAVFYHQTRPSEVTEPEEGEDDEDELELEKIPDEERVLGIVEEEGGRMKQKHVVEETGWSEAKVSQVTSRLEDEGMLRKLRMGRENILEIQEEDEDDGEGPPAL